jgi:Domain of unknown function (DUF4388)
VSLEGTLETISLPDVLALLSVTAKTGELRVESAGSIGSVWLDAGRVAGYDVSGQHSAVDALFSLLRLKDGNFRFHAGTEPQNPVEPQEVAPLMEEAEERLGQWPGISAVVPSLSSRLSLEALVNATVTLSPEQWALIALIGGGRSVAEVIDGRGLGEFDGSKAVKELVDHGLVQVDLIESPVVPVVPETVPLPPPPVEDLVPPVADDVPPTPDFHEPAPEFHEEQLVSNGWGDTELTGLSDVWNDETGQVETAPTEEDEPETGQPVNRGLLLKFLGSARS